MRRLNGDTVADNNLLMWNRLRHHAVQAEQFKRAAQKGRLAHAYLFVGPGGVGKRMFARTVAAGLFCQTSGSVDACGECPSCRQVLVSTHPDLLEVSCPPGKKSLPIELLVGSREKRGREGLCYDLSLRPMAADRRVAIIDHTETLSTESANALLKTLEEPPARSVLFLIVDRLEGVLPTIRSRCQLMTFGPLPDDDVAALLSEHEIVATAEEARAIAGLAGGSMDAAAQLADPAIRELCRFLHEKLSADGLAKALGLARSVVEKLEATASDSPTQRTNAHWVVRFLCARLQAALRDASFGRDTGIGLLPAAAPAEAIADMIDRVVMTETDLRQSMPLLLCFESLFDDLRRIGSGQLPGSVVL